ncbi:5'-nucleotidase /3'-nucleotidase /exopolyphosphatase [Desulfobotulus alkaliphilus]|uniref:5'-nucleotidase n=1 Tax=Desulfobotulus alkaliphilus TaxID=622671 RepID=A0A562RNT0_9BACT|nr:5'/3'-nucleotidase SurE [Desulfobotulus alkaliphilus]TWI70728.1 5'-nucleotidase /3'-nucleotidase /exopolyphosphatase [Desulfobotulus alkaliphilus]
MLAIPIQFWSMACLWLHHGYHPKARCDALMKTFLLTNDDGMDAPGLKALEEAVRPLGRLVVLAPAHPQSGISHRVSIWDTVDVIPEGVDRFRVFGTPADCVRIGLREIVPEADYVLSGINIGANLGYDIYLSGTVAAAREAAFQGKPAMALSQYIAAACKPDWDAARETLHALLPEFLAMPLKSLEYMNINLPQASGKPGNIPQWQSGWPETTPYDTCIRVDDQRYAYTADMHARPRPAGCDVDVCFSGRVSFTRLRI